MQHKAALGVHRPALQHRLVRQVFTRESQVHLLKQGLHVQVAGLVDDQPQGPALGVFAQIDHTAVEILIVKPGHRDQEMMRQVNRRRICAHGLLF